MPFLIKTEDFKFLFERKRGRQAEAFFIRTVGARDRQ